LEENRRSTGLPIIVSWCGDRLQVHQNETPTETDARSDYFCHRFLLHHTLPLASSLGHALIRNLERIEALRISQQINSSLDTIRRDLGTIEQFLARGLALDW